MKIAKYIYAAIAAITVCGCEDFLDTECYTKKTTATFPETQDDAVQMITGIYSTLNNAIDQPDENAFYVFDLASDDRLGGGSTSNRNAQSSDRLINKQTSWFGNYWAIRYAGIYRANTAIETIDNVKKWTSNGKREQLLGEAYFLRAFFYFELAQMFGEVPLVLETTPQNLPKSPAEDIYAQITSDLLKAIELLPATSYPNIELGHATKWAAEALLAREFLFYTGFYGKSALPSVDQGNIEKPAIVTYIEDCMNNSGHSLLADQRSLWPYTNPYTKAKYKYMDGVSAEWAGDNNQEVLFALNFSNVTVFSNKSNVGYTRAAGYSNRIVEYYGLRKAGNVASFPFVPTGYSNGPASANLWSDWAADPDYVGDYRRAGSICDLAAELPNFAGDPAKEVENTKFFAKKYAGCGVIDEDSTLYQSYSFFYDGQNDKQLGLTQSIIYIRYADVLLMHSELTETADGMNKVRARANLPAIAYSLEALKKERRYELCFEALRWNDLRRWGDVADIVKNQTGQAIINKGNPDTYAFDSNFDFMKRYEATKGGFWKIPESQVTLSNGVLEQNEGWKDGDGEWTKLPYSTI